MKRSRNGSSPKLPRGGASLVVPLCVASIVTEFNPMNLELAQALTSGGKSSASQAASVVAKPASKPRKRTWSEFFRGKPKPTTQEDPNEKGLAEKTQKPKPRKRTWSEFFRGKPKPTIQESKRDPAGEGLEGKLPKPSSERELGANPKPQTEVKINRPMPPGHSIGATDTRKPADGAGLKVKEENSKGVQVGGENNQEEQKNAAARSISRLGKDYTDRLKAMSPEQRRARDQRLEARSKMSKEELKAQRERAVAEAKAELAKLKEQKQRQAGAATSGEISNTKAPRKLDEADQKAIRRY